MAYVASIGFFDGVHRGHQFLLSQLRQEASMRNLQTAVITFEEHPKLHLQGVSPMLLTNFQERVGLLKAQHLDQIFAFRFEVIRDMSAAEFLQILHNQCDVQVLLMGYDHHFGADGVRSMDEYIRLGQEAGVEVVPLPQAPDGDVSSTKIRKALLAADIASVTRMLGYAYTMTGVVTHGRGLGHQIGFPTANIQISSPDKLIPANGVYAVRVYLPSGEEHPGVMNIGTNPTVGGNTRTIEVHIPGLSCDLYDQQLSVSLLDYLRPESQFSDVAELKEQIKCDIAKLRELE